LFGIVAVLNFMRGGKPGQKSLVGIQFCSQSFWIFTLVQAPGLIALSGLAGWYLVRTYRNKQLRRLVQPDVDLEWTTVRVLWYPVFAFFAGVFASMIGFGGGLLLAPIMLDLNMPPETVAATAALIHIMSASAAIVNYTIAGMLLWQHAVFFAAVSFTGQFVGQFIVDFLVKKYKRPSIIAISIAVMIVLASCMVIASGAIQVTKDVRTGQHLKFRSFC